VEVVSRHVLALPEGFRAREIASFVSQMDDQTRRLTADTRGATVEELGWQPAQGMNTIGMLLAHIAIVEVHWTQFGVLGRAPAPFVESLGIGGDDDGMPLPAEGTPPAALAGKDLAFFDDLLARARRQYKEVATGLAESDLDRVVTRTDRRGRARELDVRWILYHMLEHFAGHYGQILLLRHQYRARQPKA